LVAQWLAIGTEIRGDRQSGLAAGAAEEIAVDVIGDSGRFDIIVQTLVETMMTGNVVLLAAFFV